MRQRRARAKVPACFVRPHRADLACVLRPRKHNNGMADKYEKVAKVGEGSFGVVWKVKHKLSGEYFAIKKIRLESATHGVRMAAIDEIHALQVKDRETCACHVLC